MKNIKIYIFAILTIFAVFAFHNNKSFADLECDPGYTECNDQCVSSCEGGMELNSSCNCECPSEQEQCGQACFDQCPTGQVRNDECGCEPGTCTNGTVNYPECDNCGAGKYKCDGVCFPNCEDGYMRNPDSCGCIPESCTNGAINPPACDNCGSGKAFDPNPPAGEPAQCINYCDDPEACNYEEYASCTYDCAEDCCNDESALNYDDECPDPEADPEKIENNSGVCEYCTKENPNGEAVCKHYYCSDPEANNTSTLEECDADFPDRECVEGTPESHCTYDAVEFCGDTTTPALNPETQTDCNDSIPEYRRPCTRNDDLCEYPDRDYCADETATNYETEEECQDGNDNINCIAHYDEPVCEYEMCSIGFLIDVTCSDGYRFANTINNPFTFDRTLIAGGACSPSLTPSEAAVLSSYFEQLICSDTTPVCSGGLCDAVDWCPAEGVQTDPSECIDVCPDIGLQINRSQCNGAPLCLNLGNTPVPNGYYRNQQGSCYPCTGGTCHPADAVCGNSVNVGAQYISDIVGPNACAVGTKTVVTKSNLLFNWSCLGFEGGQDTSCTTGLVCGPGKTYCPTLGICLDNSKMCETPNDCENSNICVFDGSVDLNEKLMVTPIVDKNGTCEIRIDKTSEVFEAFNEDTHCVLYSQDGIIKNTFDPANLTVDAQNSTYFLQPNIKKDMTYTLKCYNGDLPETESGYAKSVGSCRLNVKTKEAN